MTLRTILMAMGQKPVLRAPISDDGEGGNADDNNVNGDDTVDDPDDDSDDDTGDDDGDDEDADEDADDDDDGDTGDDGDQEDTGKGAEKRIRKLVEEKNDLKDEVEKLKKLAGDDGKAILAAAEATGILPGLMTKDEAKAFRDMQDIPGIIERYEDWLDDHSADDELDLGGGETMSYGDVKKRVRKLRSALANLKETYGERRKVLSGKVREIFETGLAALKAGWKPDGKKTEAKKGKKKQPKEEKPTGKNPREHQRRGREWEGEVEDEDDLENFIAAENRKNRRKG